MAYIGSALFILAGFCKDNKKMRVAYILGGLIFIVLFARSDLSNQTNLSNLILNSFSVLVHLYRLATSAKKSGEKKSEPTAERKVA